MKVFLTSSPVTENRTALNPANGFRERFLSAAKDCRHGLFVASSPDEVDFTESYAAEMKELLEKEGLVFDSFEILDSRSCGKLAKLMKKADFVLLAGGHVPTQNAFFNRMPLKMLLKNFKGVILGTSAGSMNAAEEVYAQPEEPGEAIDPGYKKFLKGLGLTKVKILPHYNSVKDDVLDGKKLFEEITYPDSMGKTFFVFVDGTYILKDEDGERIYGECWTIHNGTMTKIAELNDEVWVEKE